MYVCECVAMMTMMIIDHPYRYNCFIILLQLAQSEYTLTLSDFQGAYVWSNNTTYMHHHLYLFYKVQTYLLRYCNAFKVKNEVIYGF